MKAKVSSTMEELTKLRNKRIKMGLSTYDLEPEVSHETIRRIERGYVVKLSTFTEYAKLLGVY